MFESLKIGDPVEKYFNNCRVGQQVVTDITNTEIHCGPFVYNKSTGGEIDDILEWDGKTVTNEYIRQPEMSKELDKILN